jgi:alpha-amylase/alpha-mannosidase (GH57 family)
MIGKPLLCVHGHFYQPPRMDPFTGAYRHEPDAAPYYNWNERVMAECYAPNVLAGNFDRISFNLGSTLAQWMVSESPDVFSQIVQVVRNQHRRYGVGNGLAQAMHHTILPLARGRDKRCQIRWGVASYQHWFGYHPDGLWLPEMAMDYETLEAVSEAGLWFVILSDEQVRGDLSLGAGPYKVSLSKETFMTVFVRDRGLSNHLSFNMPTPEVARDWINETMRGRQRGLLSLIATDGETFGHHHRQGVDVLHTLTTPTFQDAYEITNLGRYLRQHPPQAELEIIENTAWSCYHHLGRWATGCACTAGCGYWKGALRRALDNISHEIDEIYVDFVRRYDLAPWTLRDDYIAVLLGQMDGLTFLAEHHLAHLSTVIQQRLLMLLEAQAYRQQMFVSCSFFFEDLERIESRYAIANAVKAIASVMYVTGDDLTKGFRRDLSVAVSPSTGRTGGQILDEILVEARFGESPLGGSMGPTRPKEVPDTVDEEVASVEEAQEKENALSLADPVADALPTPLSEEDEVIPDCDEEVPPVAEGEGVGEGGVS